MGKLNTALQGTIYFFSSKKSPKDTAAKKQRMKKKETLKEDVDDPSD